MSGQDDYGELPLRGKKNVALREHPSKVSGLSVKFSVCVLHTHTQDKNPCKTGHSWWKATAGQKFQLCLAWKTGLILHAVRYSGEVEWMENPTLESYINISFPHIVLQLKSSHNEAGGDSPGRVVNHWDGCQEHCEKDRRSTTAPTNPGPSYLLGDGTRPEKQCSRIPSPKPPPSHCQPANSVKPGESKQPADLISSSGVLRDSWIVPLKEETLVESSGRGGKVARTFSPSLLLGYKLYSLTGAEVSSCQPDFPLRTNVVRLQQ